MIDSLAQKEAINIMKLHNIARLALVLMLAFTVSGCGQVRIGYIDGTKVMEDAPQIKAILTEAEQKLSEAQKEAEAEMAKTDGTDEEERQKKQLEAQRKLMGINQQYSAQLRQKLDATLAQVAAEKKLDVVLESVEMQKSVVQGGTDVTDEVIQKLQ